MTTSPATKQRRPSQSAPRCSQLPTSRMQRARCGDWTVKPPTLSVLHKAAANGGADSTRQASLSATARWTTSTSSTMTAPSSTRRKATSGPKATWVATTNASQTNHWFHRLMSSAQARTPSVPLIPRSPSTASVHSSDSTKPTTAANCRTKAPVLRYQPSPTRCTSTATTTALNA